MDEAGLGDWSGRSRGGGFGHRFFIFLVRRAGIGFAYGFLALVVVYFIPFAPVLLTSATQGKNITKIFDLALDIQKERQTMFDGGGLHIAINPNVSCSDGIKKISHA